jgi:hypothetical protein
MGFSSSRFTEKHLLVVHKHNLGIAIAEIDWKPMIGYFLSIALEERNSHRPATIETAIIYGNRGISRVCRDYYGFWWIVGRAKFTGIPRLFNRECAVRHIVFHSPEEFISPDLIETARREWDQQLSPFLAKDPQKERILDEVQALILALF